MAMGIRVMGDEEGEGDVAGDGIDNEGGVQQRERWLWQQEHGNKGGRQLTVTRAMVTATAMTLVMVMVTRLAGDEEGKGEGGKGDGNSDERWWVTKRQWRRRQEQWRQRQWWRSSDGDGDEEGDGDGDGDKGGRGGGRRNAHWQRQQERW